MKVLSVSGLNNYIKNIFDAEELLHNIPVVGEVFGVSQSRNILYFSLRDEASSLSCVCFYPALFADIVEGREVVVTGSPNYYTKGGKLSFVVNKVDQSGQGKLYEEFLKLKNKLESEGLFDSSHKKPLPKSIKRIGVVTSSEGAVLQDIKQVGWRRNPALDIVLFSTRVQGRGAEYEIANAITAFGNYDKIDCIVVARGGGSLEDLWAYNTEVVARAVYNCPKPVVSAVGHETDYTIIDFVSDMRAPTPSAAAEILTEDIAERKRKFFDLVQNVSFCGTEFLQQRQENLDDNKNRLIVKLERIILGITNQFDKTSLRFINDAERFVQERSFALGMLETAIAKLNPTALLKSGYARVEQNGQVLQSAQSVQLASEMQIYFKDGSVTAMPKTKHITGEE